MSEQPSNNYVYNEAEAREAQIRYDIEHSEAALLDDGAEAHFHDSSEPYREYDVEAVIKGRLAYEAPQISREVVISGPEISQAKLTTLTSIRKLASNKSSQDKSDYELAA